MRLCGSSLFLIIAILLYKYFRIIKGQINIGWDSEKIKKVGFGYLCTPKIGVGDRNIKMVFNTGGTWRWITFEKLMMKIYDFF